MCRISHKFAKNESYQIFTNICKPNLAYLTTMYSSKNWLKMLSKNLSYQTVLIKSNINVKRASYKYLQLKIFVTFGGISTWMTE
jgi:hypothetical protein